MTVRTVHLVGGPFHGDEHERNAVCQVFTIDWVDGTKERVYGGRTVQVDQIMLATYRRVDEETFEHCRDPCFLGEGTDLAFRQEQLTIEEE